MLYWLCERADRPFTWPQLEHAIRRNFGGLDDKNLDPLEEFKKKIPNREDPDLTHIPPEVSFDVFSSRVFREILCIHIFIHKLILLPH